MLLSSLAPSSPRNVIAMATSSTSINVTWTESEMLNGNIRYYNVTFFSTDDGISENITQQVNSPNIQLFDLEAFTNYTMFVQAFTVALSPQSGSVTEQTFEDGNMIVGFLIIINFIQCFLCFLFSL